MKITDYRFNRTDSHNNLIGCSEKQVYPEELNEKLKKISKVLKKHKVKVDLEKKDE